MEASVSLQSVKAWQEGPASAPSLSTSTQFSVEGPPSFGSDMPP